VNILYLHTHDTGRYIQPYGHAVPTPNLLELAQNGTLFRQCFCAGPTCSPSRAALLTGQFPHQCGMTGLAHRGFALSDRSHHLASFLATQGWQTVLCGMQHETDFGHETELGYTRVLEAEGMPVWRNGFSEHEHGVFYTAQDRARAAAAAAFLKRKHDRPFFLSFGMNATHRPYPLAAADINADYLQPPLPVHDNPATRLDMAEFVTMAACADGCVGTVLAALSEAGLDDDTFVFFTTDHGIAFPKMKCHLYDTGIGVALIVRYPGNRSVGKAIEALVSHVDLFPTLCDMASVPRPAWLEGNSMRPLFDATVPAIRDEVFSEVTYHAAYEPMRCVRTVRHKYIRYFDDFDKVVKPNMDDGLSKRFLMEHGLMDQEHDPKEMLFDLYHDPLERVNLVDSPRHQQVRQDLTLRLEHWMKRTGDPLLAGCVAKPAGARANRKTGVQPSDDDWED
jgi:N-sulfoglucosamine sulfohydrolase